MFQHPIVAWPTAAPPPGEQRRASERHATVLLIGRVRRDAGESACLVHDLSRHGLMARFTVTPRVGDRLRIAVRGLAEVAATVRWVDGFRGGVEFDRPHDIAGVFRPRDDRGHVARAPRFAMRAGASLRLGDARLTVDVLDISPGGVKLRSDVAVHGGQAGSLLLPQSDAAAFGTVCWTREDRFGFRFCTPLTLASLSRVLGCG
jgi:hypothetical protein